MPRVARRQEAKTAASPFKSPVKIPLNDDTQEKAARLQSRQALQEIQYNSIRAAASPARRMAQYEKGKGTPDGRRAGADENDDEWAAVTGGDTMTPMKRVPILANFEEWMKMATDNKINATNSWNFALIDYFHDMSLLKEGDSVNFQKASCTLDGCVKIYTSRVDSVATETGKLLSGLADSRNSNKKAGNAEGDEGEDDEDDDDEDGEGRKKSRKKAQRSSEATLATSFAQIQLKKFELEFAVDPLFKKASADFDEGGAKGLLLNHLCIDSTGRIVFDSSDDTDEGIQTASIPTDSQEQRAEQGEIEEASILEDEAAEDEIELGDLASKFFPDLALLDEQDICPSLKNLDLGETMDLASLPMLQDQKNKDDKKNDSQLNSDDDPGLFALGDDDADEPEFGMGGDAWAQQAGLEPTFGMPADDQASGEAQGEADEGNYDEDSSFAIKMQFNNRDNGHADILGYFDNTLKANWAGPEHWRIKKMKQDTGPREVTKRKPKEPFEIDFQSALPQKLAEQIYTPASSSSAISLPKVQWRSRTRHLLPDDKHFNSTHLLRLFLKPKARIGRRGTRRPLRNAPTDGSEPRHLDDAYWAKAQEQTEEPPKNEYDADFFQEDDGGFPLAMFDEEDAFEDARETFTPAFGVDQGAAVNGEGVPADAGAGGLSNLGYGSSLVTQSRRLRPEYVSYAKVAKKVDVRMLKEKMWRGIGFQDIIEPPKSSEPVADADAEVGPQLQFTSVMNNLQSAYSTEAMADISTSYCFISLLHLANEKGLILSNDQGLEELSIRRDMTADMSAAA